MTFLEKQKFANCPCQIHAASRGYDWVVFRRQPDRTPTLYYEQTGSESEEEIHEEYEDDDYDSVEPIDLDTGEEKEDQDVTGAATFSEVPTDKTTDKSEDKSEQGDKISIHSRENDSSDEEEEEKKEKKSQKKSLNKDEEDM